MSSHHEVVEIQRGRRNLVVANSADSSCEVDYVGGGEGLQHGVCSPRNREVILVMGGGDH